MASLGDLLAEDGFRNKPRRSRLAAIRAAPRALSMPLYSDPAGNRLSRHPALKEVVYGRSRTGFLRSNERPRYEFEQENSDAKRIEEMGYGSQSCKKEKLRREEDEIFEGNQGFDDQTPTREPTRPTIYDAAIVALISILTGHIRVFFNDQSFRASLHSRCNSCLEASDRDERSQGVFAELEKAIAEIERAVEKGRGQKELHKASRKLSVIAGLALSSNSRPAAACAHLYLGVVCAIHGKSRAAAAHLLEVFRVVPHEARFILLPDLWERLFLPQLSHLTAWYEEERNSIARTASRTADKMKVLDKKYSDVLNLGTRKFAVYYKEWLDGETLAAPSTPSVHAPSASLPRITQGVVHYSEQDEASSSRNILSSIPMVSEISYQSVIDAANLETGEHDVEEGKEKEHAQESPKTSSEKLDESSNDKENECTLTRLAKAVFELQMFNENFQNKISVHFDSLDNNVPLSKVRSTNLKSKKSVLISKNSDNYHHELLFSGFSAELFQTDGGSILSQQQVSESCRSVLVLTAQVAEIEPVKNDESDENDIATGIVDRLLTGCSKEDQLENARYLVALGGLHFLMCRFERGNLEEKTRVVRHLLCCIKANGCCRNYVANSLKTSCVLELLHSENFSGRTDAVSLLIELICLNRRRDITTFLSGFLTEKITNTMHVLLVRLQNSPPDEKALVAVLLLHFDLMLGGHQKSIYKEEAVDAINLALNCCFHDSKMVPNTQRALLMLGGRLCSSGDQVCALVDDDDDEVDDNSLSEDEEATQKEKWQRDMCLVLAGNGKESFLKTLSRCLVSANNQEVVWTSLVTVTWMSHAFAALPASQHHRVKPLVAALLSLIPRLEEQGEREEHCRVLAATSLQNFAKISSKEMFSRHVRREIQEDLRIKGGVGEEEEKRERKNISFYDHRHDRLMTGECSSKKVL